MTDVDDDDISITSTAPSEQLSEYEVETILTEANLDDGVLYLVKWAGYPIERSTWEPAESFSTDETFADWGKKKKAISEGKKPAFDIASWENHLIALDQARDKRKQKREAKRKRLGASGSQTDIAKKQRVDANHSTSSSSENPSSFNIAASGVPRQNSSASTLKRQYVPPRPPMVMFGSSQHRPGPWMAARSKRPNGPDGQGKAYNLSTMWRYEKAKGYEPAPDINKLELARPSEWPPRNNAPTPKIGNHQVSSPKGIPSLPSPEEGDNLAPGNDRLPPTSPEAPGSGTRLQSHVSDARRPNSPNLRGSWGPRQPSLWDSYRPDSPMSRAPWRPEKGAPWDTRRPIDDKRSPPSILDHDINTEEPHIYQSSPVNDTHDDQEPDEEPIPPLPPRRPSTIKGANFRRALDDHNTSRFWNPGEVFAYMYIGPDKKAIGPIRLCGLSIISKTKILHSKKGRKMEIWFQEICTLDDYRHLCSRSKSNIRFDNGWIEGYDDTEPDVYRMGQKLRHNNLLAISYPEEPSHGKNVLLAFSRFSEDFDFLRDNHTFSSDTFLHITVRNPLPRIDQPSLFNRVTRSSIPSRVEPQREGSPNRSRSATVQVSMPIEQRIEERIERRIGQKAPEAATTQLTHLPSEHSLVFAQGDHDHSHDALYERKGQTASHNQLVSTKEPLWGTEDHAVSQAQTTESYGPTPTGQVLAREKPQEDVSVENFDVDVFFKDVFNMTFDTLATNNGLEKGCAQVFYLMCPSENASVQKECEVLIEFLKKHRGVIFSNRLEEDWERFVRTINRGIVVFHDSFVNYDKMSSLKDLIQKPFTFWSFSLTGIEEGGQTTFFQRLFPHGGVILLTEDFMTQEPDASIILLAWFNDWSSKKFPGSWKMMVRPNVLGWLLKQPEPKEKARQGIWLVMYRLIVQLNMDGNASYSSDDEPLDGIHDDLSEKRVISLHSLPLYGSRTEDDCPDLPKGLTQEQRNTDHLAEFFAGWALVNSHRFRRFVIVTSLIPLQRWSAWNHIDIKEGARDFFKAYAVDYKMYWSKLKSTGKPGRAGKKKTPLPPQKSPNITESISSPTISRPPEFNESDRSKFWPTQGPSRL